MFFENPGLSFLLYIIQHMPRKACNCVSIVFAFMCGRAGETILIRYVWTRPMGNVQYKWLSGDPRCLLAKQKYFSNKATRHSWVLKTCYYSEKGRQTDGNFNSILKINFLRWMDRIKSSLLEETGYEKRQTSMIKTTVLQFMFKAPWKCTILCFLSANCYGIN